MMRYLLIIVGITTSWLHSQPVYNLLMDSSPIQQTHHCIFAFEGYSVVVGERLGINGGYNSQIFTLRISDAGEILGEQIVYEADTTRYGIESTGYNGVQIGDKLFINLNREYGIFTQIHHPQLFVLDTLGQLLHTKENILSEANEGIMGINKTNDNGLVMVGIRHYSGTDGALLMMVTDTLGTVQWEREIRYMGEYRAEGFCVAQMPNGDFIISGDTYKYNTNWQMYYARTDSLGNVLWEHDLGVGGEWDGPAWFELREDGGINLFGRNNEKSYFAKIDGDGNIYYSIDYQMGGSSINRFPIKLDSIYLFLIYHDPNLTGNPSYNQLWSMDTSFQKISEIELGTLNGYNGLRDIKKSPDCSLVAAGDAYTNLGHYVGWVIKTNLAGESCGEPDCYDEYINEYGDCVGTGTSIDNPPSLANEVNISISPNPGSGWYNIKWASGLDNLDSNLKLLDMFGRIIITRTGIKENNCNLDISHLPSGTYFIEIESGLINHSGRLIHIQK